MRKSVRPVLQLAVAPLLEIALRISHELVVIHRMTTGRAVFLLEEDVRFSVEEAVRVYTFALAQTGGAGHVDREED
jgi:hypothetical protein